MSSEDTAERQARELPPESPAGNPADAAPETSPETPKRRSRLKKVLRIIAWTLAVTLVLLILLVTFRDFVIRHAITGVGSWVTGTKITLENFETSLSEGDVRITNLKVASLDGYAKPYLFELDSFYLNLGLKTLFTKEVLVEEVDVNGMRITCEFNPNGRFNMVHLMDNVQAKFPPDDKPKDPPENPTTVTIGVINISNSSLIVYDDRVGVTVLPLPLVYSQSQASFTDTGEDIIVLLADFARYLQDKCSGVANAKELVNDAGKKVWDSTSDTGKKVWDSTSNTGKKVWDSTSDTGKKLVDVFKF